MNEPICPNGVKKEKTTVSPEQPPGFDQVSTAERELRQDQALALREAGEDFETIAERLGYDCKGCAHRAVERAMWRRVPDQATASRLMEIDSKMLRLWPRLRRRDPSALLQLRNLAHERLTLMQPSLADTPLPDANPQERERDRQLVNTLRAMQREEAKLLASIPQPSPEEMVELASDFGIRFRDGFPRPPRRGRRR